MSDCENIKVACRYRAIFGCAGLPNVPGPPILSACLTPTSPCEHQEMPSDFLSTAQRAVRPQPSMETTGIAAGGWYEDIGFLEAIGGF